MYSFWVPAPLDGATHFQGGGLAPHLLFSVNTVKVTPKTVIILKTPKEKVLPDNGAHMEGLLEEEREGAEKGAKIPGDKSNGKEKRERESAKVWDRLQVLHVRAPVRM